MFKFRSRMHPWEISRRLKEAFPDELGRVSSEDIEEKIALSEMEIYSVEPEPIKWWLRLTLPLAIIVIGLLFIFSPIKYMFTGRWNYSILWLKNWLTALRF